MSENAKFPEEGKDDWESQSDEEDGGVQLSQLQEFSNSPPPGNMGFPSHALEFFPDSWERMDFTILPLTHELFVEAHVAWMPSKRKSKKRIRVTQLPSHEITHPLISNKQVVHKIQDELRDKLNSLAKPKIMSTGSPLHLRICLGDALTITNDPPADTRLLAPILSGPVSIDWNNGKGGWNTVYYASSGFGGHKTSSHVGSNLLQWLHGVGNEEVEQKVNREKIIIRGVHQCYLVFMNT